MPSGKPDPGPAGASGRSGGQSDSGGECPSEDALLGLLGGGGAGVADRSAAERHLDGCEQCQAALGAAASRSRSTPADGTQRTPADVLPLQELETQGRYLVRGEHGRGGQSVVLRAFDVRMGREIALKALRGGADGPSPADSNAARRFLREARLTAQLEHPGIAPVHEIGRRADGRLYYTQKLVRGRTFARALAEADTLADRLRLVPHFAGICQAVAYAHERGIIHRDLKPANVMVGELGETVVLDWGLAKRRGEAELGEAAAPPASTGAAGAPTGASPAVNRYAGGDGGGTTQQGTLLGTPSYTSPEQAAGEVGAVDERSDVFSLGVMLYELLAGRRRFVAGTPVALLFQVRSAAPSPIRELCPAAPPELVAVAERALARCASQ